MAVDQSGVWRFRDLLPIVDDLEKVVTLREGNTPLYDLPRCAKAAGIDWLLAKHQGMNPTGSFKDTGMTAALSVAAERGFEWVACASTGNTSAAMAAYAARAGLRSIVFIPEGKIAWGKLSQAMDYGALTIQLKTDFDGCVRILGELVQKFPIYLLNSVNPYRLEGQKTPAFEMVEQMDWQVPEHIVVPGGNLANSAALGKGFSEMYQLGLIPRLPKISIIQAEGANPLYRWFIDSNRVMKPVTADTRATAIRIGNPGLLAQGRGGHRRSRRLVRAGLRAGDRAGQGRDRRRGSRLRTRLGCHARRPQKTCRAGQDHPGGARRPDPHRPHAQGLAVHHRLPPQRALHRRREGPAHPRATRLATQHCASRPSCSKPTRRGPAHARVAHEPAPARMTTSAQSKPFHLRLPATSANLGPGFDALGLAMALYLTIDATTAEEFHIDATGRNADSVRRLEDNLILTTYMDVLANAGILARRAPPEAPQ